ncbi:hypothetical protein Tco_0944161 [Tanacetum coccineum]
MEDKEAKSTMRMVIKREFKKLETLKINDVSLTYDVSLKSFHTEFYRLSRMDDDLFTYEVEIANIQSDLKGDDDSGEKMSREADDDMGYDPFDNEFTSWLASKYFNYKTMDHYTKKALWIYWIREDDEVELTDEESSDDEYEGVEVFRIDTNDYEWYEALEDSDLKKVALWNKAIMEGLINEDNDDESRYKRRKRWNVYDDTNIDHECEIDHEAKERLELCSNETHELPVCTIRRFEMTKYSFEQDE